MDENKIETILNKLAEHGYKTRAKTTELEKLKVEYNYCKFVFNLQNNNLVIEGFIKFNNRTTFAKEDSLFLNSIAPYWSIYNNWIRFVYVPKDEQELEDTLLQLLENYNN